MKRHHWIAFLYLLLFALMIAACGSADTPMPAATQAVQASNTPAQVAQATATLPPEPTLPPAATDTSVPPSATPAPSETAAPSATQPEPTDIPDTPVPSPEAVAPLTRSLYLETPNLSGDDVLHLQQRLLALGYSEVGTPDGVFGSMTDSAVRRFQTDNGLVVDGVVGPVTWEILFGSALPTPEVQPTTESQLEPDRIFRLSIIDPVELIYDGDEMWVQTVHGLLRYDDETGERTRERTLARDRGQAVTCYDEGGFYYLASYETEMAGGSYQWVSHLLFQDVETKEEELVMDLTYYDNLGIYFQKLACHDEQFWLSVAGETYIMVFEPDSDAAPKFIRNVYLGSLVMDIAYGDDSMWVLEQNAVVHQVDPDSGGILASYQYPVGWLSAWTWLFYGGDRLWMSSIDISEVWSLDPETGKTTLFYAPDYQVAPVGCDGRYLWVTVYDWDGLALYLFDIREE